jgi:regulator of cell morphogenesis and NO signaling
MNTIAPDTLPQAQLIEHLLERYHARHREQLPELIRLASRVEQVHGHHLACPNGLADLLRDIEQELEGHMLKEEQVLFPMQALTNHIQPPSDACNTWRALYHGLEVFHGDLLEHIHLENDVLFVRALKA